MPNTYEQAAQLEIIALAPAQEIVMDDSALDDSAASAQRISL